MAPAVAAHHGAIWDGRFRLHASATPPEGARLGPLGPLGSGGAAGLRHQAKLPAAVLATLPAIRHGKTLFAVPHLGYPDADRCAQTKIWFSPAHQAAGAPFAFAPE
jgi:tRNA(Ile)-lysidine synthase